MECFIRLILCLIPQLERFCSYSYPKRLHCICTSKTCSRPDPYISTLDVYDDQGRYHCIEFGMCGCQLSTEALVQHGLWPASPDLPTTAYSIQFLELMKAMLLGCQVSLKGFCDSMSERFDFDMTQTRSLYRLLVTDSFREYKYMCYKRAELVKLKDKYPCPVCPEENRVINIDGNFGLVRKKSSGKSFKPPLYTDIKFIDTSSIENPVADASNVLETACSDFKAGNTLRSKKKSQKLDITGVFGSVCKHEIPIKFLDMTQGERMEYPVALLTDILKMCSGITLVNYDIACRFETYLQRSVIGRSILEKIKLGLPIFHMYGHQPACHVKYNPRWLEGYGVVDGEGVERLWSYLRKFHSITKEMTPANRTDLLTEALLYYTDKKLRKLPDAVITRHNQAVRQAEALESSIERLCLENDVPKPDRATVKSYQLLEEEHFKSALPQKSTWQEKYVRDLMKLEMLTSECAAGVIDATKRGERILLEEKVRNVEKKYAIQLRWNQDDENFQAAARTISRKERNSALNAMLTVARELKFLQSLLHRYSAGQAIAARLSQRIKAAGSKLRKILATYNTKQSTPTNIITESNARDPTSEIYKGFISDSSLPHPIRRDIIDVTQRYERTKEEVEMTQNEAQRLCKFLFFIEETLNKRISYTSSNDSIVSLGRKAYLKVARDDVKRKLFYLRAKLGQINRMNCDEELLDSDVEVYSSDNTDDDADDN